MNIELLEQIFKYASAILSLCIFLFTATCFVINKVKQKNKRINAEEEVEELTDELREEKSTIKLLTEIIPVAIKKVEAIPLIDGATKKMLALSEILLNCNENNINFEDYKTFINEQIEALIDFSKVVNKRKAE